MQIAQCTAKRIILVAAQRRQYDIQEHEGLWSACIYLSGPRQELGYYTSWSSAAATVDKAFTFLVSHVGFMCSSKQCKSTTTALSTQPGRHACCHDRDSCDTTCKKRQVWYISNSNARDNAQGEEPTCLPQSQYDADEVRASARNIQDFARGQRKHADRALREAGHLVPGK